MASFQPSTLLRVLLAWRFGSGRPGRWVNTKSPQSRFSKGNPSSKYCWYARFRNFPILIHFVVLGTGNHVDICTTPNRIAFPYLKYRGNTLNKFGYKKYKVSLFGVAKKSHIQIYHEKLVFIHLMVP